MIPIDWGASLETENGLCPYLAAEVAAYGGDGWGIEPSEGALTYMQRLRDRGYAFRPTNDWWAPNFPGGLVAVGIQPHYSLKTIRRCQSRRIDPTVQGPDSWFVIVMGADDDTCHIEVESHDVARAIYLAMPPVICKSDLYRMGFRW